MPKNTVYVGRPSFFGNPFKVGNRSISLLGGTIKDKFAATQLFKDWIAEGGITSEDIESLKGKNLACWCSLDEPCHADILLEVANS